MSTSRIRGYDADAEQPNRKLVVVHNAMDDEGGGDHTEEGEAHESAEGGRYVMPAIRDGVNETRTEIEELGVITMDLPDEPADPKAKYLDEIVRVAPEGISQVREAFLEGNKVLSLGGNHVRALDVIGALRACHELGIPFGMIWVDQHLDLNTPQTSPSGNIHGMVSAVLQGKGAKGLLDLLEGAPFIDPRNMIYIGVREKAIDGHETKDENGRYAEDTEGYLLQQLEDKGVRCFTSDSMSRDKQHVSDEAKEAAKELSDRIKGEGGRLWTEWDVDVVDTADMPAAVMKNVKGLSKEQMQDLFNFMKEHCSVDGMGVSEISPDKDIDGKSKELVAEGVAKILGISAEEAVQLASHAPRKWRRTLQIAGSIAAGISALVVGHQLSDTPTEKPARPIVDSSHSEFLAQFSGAEFRTTADQLKRAVESDDQDGIKSALGSLADIYVQAKKKAPSTAAASDLGRVALSEFTHGFTGGTFAGSANLQRYYQSYLEAIRSNQDHV